VLWAVLDEQGSKIQLEELDRTVASQEYTLHRTFCCKEYGLNRQPQQQQYHYKTTLACRCSQILEYTENSARKTSAAPSARKLAPLAQRCRPYPYPWNSYLPVVFQVFVHQS
jgi:hypothetical protein